MFLSSQCPCLTSSGVREYTPDIFPLHNMLVSSYSRTYIRPLSTKCGATILGLRGEVTGCRELGTTRGAREFTVPDEDDGYRMTIRTCPTCIWSLRARWMMVRKKSWRRNFDHVMLGLIVPMPKQVDQYDHVRGPPWVKAR